MHSGHCSSVQFKPCFYTPACHFEVILKTLISCFRCPRLIINLKLSLGVEFIILVGHLFFMWAGTMFMACHVLLHCSSKVCNNLDLLCFWKKYLMITKAALFMKHTVKLIVILWNTIIIYNNSFIFEYILKYNLWPYLEHKTSQK